MCVCVCVVCVVCVWCVCLCVCVHVQGEQEGLAGQTSHPKLVPAQSVRNDTTFNCSAATIRSYHHISVISPHSCNSLLLYKVFLTLLPPQPLLLCQQACLRRLRQVLLLSIAFLTYAFQRCALNTRTTKAVSYATGTPPPLKPPPLSPSSLLLPPPTPPFSPNRVPKTLVCTTLMLLYQLLGATSVVLAKIPMKRGLQLAESCRIHSSQAPA